LRHAEDAEAEIEVATSEQAEITVLRRERIFPFEDDGPLSRITSLVLDIDHGKPAEIS